MKEIWKPIKNYNYEVSNLGNVRNIKTKRVLKPEYSNKGYACVQLIKNHKIKKFRIHRLVAKLFIPNPDNLPEVNHKDEDKSNNCVENLEWCNKSYNVNYSKHKYQKPVYCFDLDIVFESASVAKSKTKVNRSSIVKACNNKLKSAGGMLWSYEQDKDKFTP